MSYAYANADWLFPRGPRCRIELCNLLKEDRQRFVSVPPSINVSPSELGEVSLWELIKTKID